MPVIRHTKKPPEGGSEPARAPDSTPVAAVDPSPASEEMKLVPQGGLKVSPAPYEADPAEPDLLADDSPTELLQELSRLQERIKRMQPGTGRQDSMLRTLNLMWERMQEMSSVLGNRAAEERLSHQQQNQMLMGLDSLKALLEEGRASGRERHDIVIGHLATLVKALKDSLDQFEVSTDAYRSQVLQELQQTEDRLMTGQQAAVLKGLAGLAPAVRELRSHLVEGMEQGHQQLLERLEAQQERTASSLAELGPAVRELRSELVEGMEQGHQQLLERLEAQQERTAQTLAGLAPAVRELRSELVEGMEQGHQQLLERLAGMEQKAAQDLDGVMQERDQMREALEIVAQALKRLRQKLQDSSEEQEARFMRELEAAEARSLKNLSQLRSQIVEEQRSGTVELQERMRMGIAEPLKGTVILLNDRVNDLQATMDRVLVHLRRIDQRVGGGGSRPPER